MSEVFPNIKCVSLQDPHYNGIPTRDEHLFQPHIDTINEIRAKLEAGERVYLGITTGERKGSIAYIQKLNNDFDQNPPELYRYNSYSRDRQTSTRLQNATIYCILGWDGRRNKIKWSTYHMTVYLPDYEGPTVWEKFDKKAEAAKALKKKILDREGNALAVGDRVLYINARYGGGASLDRGTISEIKATVQVYGEQKWPTVHVMIENDNGEMSDIREHRQSILKTP